MGRRLLPRNVCRGSWTRLPTRPRGRVMAVGAAVTRRVLSLRDPIASMRMEFPPPPNNGKGGKGGQPKKQNAGQQAGGFAKRQKRGGKGGR